ncbi:Murein DD-endopeptidase MepM and murein hydrolase activator NlpD, contain LysM domain [Thiothrix eikelboomii]|uniref:Murein DD-endopeptidase MepM and murein hydrolase activator NlpD, contain LysM domain n=1 Tax=Thiothrix eikelboomii TaxID=92487 RepID=A0A1T4W7E8_9GAMM|nr:M23 family metallopeptidase [Thiothrix eikelboomii]SKA73202.1 Murein DD-endopeptidase MepM and murein hydrolase activator NlpD, contain LysM domain [Thiothrix eikelboomii]
MVRAITILTGLTLLACACTTQAFPTQQAVPGGLVIIPVAKQSQAAPLAYYAGQRVTIVPHQGEWLALVGIPLDAKPGPQQLEVASAGQQETISFAISHKSYRTQRLRLADHNTVEPDEASSARIIQELALQKRLVRQFSEQEAQTEFIRPVAGRDSGRFGLRRILNGHQRQPHSGMDIAAASGTPVRVAASGRVIYTGTLFFSGQVVYVDHGGGLLSMYAHLSQIHVQQGEMVTQGDLLGLVGKTGRATGPHLHWSVYLNGAAVNPALFLQKGN